jgi:hypothetical protein
MTRIGPFDIHLGRLHVIAQRCIKHALWPVAVAVAFGVGTVVGEQAPPTESKGAQISAPETIDLAPWAGDMKGRQLRIRKFTIEPGGVLGIHSWGRTRTVGLAEELLNRHRSPEPLRAIVELDTIALALLQPHSRLGCAIGL